MAITYFGLGGTKQLHQIVMAGSHDAGITSGRRFERTQALTIGDQALAGVRLFDIRIAGNVVKTDQGHKQVELKTYHGKAKADAVKGPVKGLPTRRIIDGDTLSYGTWGEGLAHILQEARNFVHAHTHEFLLLKFDKCKNWDAIAELSISKLGFALYTNGGNLNETTLNNLQGKVVVLFTPDGYHAIDPSYRGTRGILQIKNLYPGGAYDPHFQGLQYWGKGGTNMMTVGTGRSIKENVRKQTKILKAAGGGDPCVMGMMYWTTTGLFGNIKKRNAKMWAPKYTNAMCDLWQGVQPFVTDRLPAIHHPDASGGGAHAQKFIPNFVMIDFADDTKCQTIYDLNKQTPTAIHELTQLVVHREQPL